MKIAVVVLLLSTPALGQTLPPPTTFTPPPTPEPTYVPQPATVIDSSRDAERAQRRHEFELGQELLSAKRRGRMEAPPNRAPSMNDLLRKPR